MARNINMGQGGTYNQAPIIVEGDYVQGSRRTVERDDSSEDANSSRSNRTVNGNFTVNESIEISGRVIKGDKYQ